MATLFTITKSLGYYGSGKNREELEIDETACLFGTDLWDIVKAYAGIRGVSKTAALMKQVLTPAKVAEELESRNHVGVTEFQANYRWLDMPDILPELRDIRDEDVEDEWLWKDDEYEEDEDGFRTYKDDKDHEFRERQQYKIHDIKQDIKNEESRQYKGTLRHIYPPSHFEPDYEVKSELLTIKLQDLA